jgi:hypothetical protein
MRRLLPSLFKDARTGAFLAVASLCFGRARLPAKAARLRGVQ